MMPEPMKPLPCLFCDNVQPRLTIKNDGVWCDKEGCPNRGNTYAVSVWQGLPRALRWTTEPPKVAGWYWCRLSRLNMPRCVEVYGSEDGLRVGSGESWRDPSISVKSDAFEWAGPIPPPID